MFAKWRGRVGKGAIMALVAVCLSFGLVVTTPSNAQAFVDGGVISGPAIVGATAVAGGSVATGVLIASGIGLVALAAVAVIALHENGVFKYPWEQPDNPISPTDKQVQQESPSKEPTTGGPIIAGTGTWLATERMVLSPIADNGSGRASFTVTNAGSAMQTNWTYNFFARTEVVCRSDAGGADRRIIGYVTSPSFSQGVAGDRPGGATSTKTLTLGGCYASETLVDALVRPFTPSEFGKLDADSNNQFSTKAAPYQIYDGPNKEQWWHKKGAKYSSPQIKTTVTCVNPAGVQADISATRDVDESGDATVEVPSCAAAGLGVPLRSVTNFLDGGQIRGKPMIDVHQGDTKYTDCDPVMGQICKMQIFVDGKPCVVGSPACASWPGLARVNPSRVQCKYGENVIDISGCGIMEGAYVAGGTPAVSENIDGNPDTWRVPGSVPGWEPHTVTPEGPAPDPSITPGPSPAPSPAPDVPADPSPDPGGDPAPDPVPGTGGKPNPSDGAGQQCWPSGWGMFNPAEWVLRPLNCAFVPKTSIQTRVTTLIPTISGKPPFSWLGGPMVGPGGGACPSWTVHVAALSKNVVCDSPFIAAVRGARLPLFGLVASAMIWPLLRSLWYASIPILRATPTGGK